MDGPPELEDMAKVLRTKRYKKLQVIPSGELCESFVDQALFGHFTKFQIYL